MTSTLCPCGSLLPYTTCCHDLHVNKNAPTAKALMRSRYSAYVLGLVEYLVETTHPAHRPPLLTSETAYTCKVITWTKLEILSHWQGEDKDKVGKVEFKATYTQDGQTSVHHELSRFKRYKGAWMYVDGEIYAS